MQPLVFLTTRTIYNGVKRALTSPQRLIGLIFVLLYYFQFLFRSMTGGSARGLPNNVQFSLPPISTIDAIVFAVFAALSLLLAMGALSPRGGFRPADVDVLFATPLSPRIVLVFRIVRDYLITLILPIIFSLLTGPGARVGYQFIFRTMPSGSRYAGTAFTLAWLLMALMWVCLGYGLSLFINRSDEQSDFNKKVINWVSFALFLITLGYIGWRLRSDLSVATFLDLAHNPLLRTAFFGASFAAALVMGVYQGSIGLAALGAGMLLAVSGFGIWLAMTQVSYMYDQAAARGFDAVNLRKLQRSGDQYGMVAEQARQGKLKTGRIAGRISRMHVTGGATLVWKELILQTRGAMFQYYIFGPLVLFLVLAPIYGVSRDERPAPLLVESTMLLGFEAMGVFMITMNNATSGFIELLRRVDIQKPLPFSPTTTVFWEVVAKTVPTFIITFLASLGALIIAPNLVWVGLSSIVLMPSLALVLTAVVLLVTILFPDVEDATQRSFRGLMVLLGCAISASPGVLVFALLFGLLHLNSLLAAIPAVAINVGAAIGLSAIAGALYAQFNPSE